MTVSSTLHPLHLFLDFSKYSSLREAYKEDPGHLITCELLFLKIAETFLTPENYKNKSPCNLLLREIRVINYCLKNKSYISSLNIRDPLKEYIASEEEELIFASYSTSMHTTCCSLDTAYPSEEKTLPFNETWKITEKPQHDSFLISSQNPFFVQLKNNITSYKKRKLQIIVRTIIPLANSSIFFWKDPLSLSLFTNLLLLVHHLSLSYLEKIPSFQTCDEESVLEIVQEGQKKFTVAFTNATSFSFSLKLRQNFIDILASKKIPFSYIESHIDLGNRIKKHTYLLRSIEKLCKTPVEENVLKKDLILQLYFIFNKYAPLLKALKDLKNPRLSEKEASELIKWIQEDKALEELAIFQKSQEEIPTYPLAALMCLNNLYYLTKCQLEIYEVALEIKSSPEQEKSLFQKREILLEHLEFYELSVYNFLKHFPASLKRNLLDKDLIQELSFIFEKYNPLLKILEDLCDPNLDEEETSKLIKSIQEKKFLEEIAVFQKSRENIATYPPEALTCLDALYYSTKYHLEIYELLVKIKRAPEQEETLFEELDTLSRSLKIYKNSFYAFLKYAPFHLIEFLDLTSPLYCEDDLEEAFKKKDFTLLYQIASQDPQHAELSELLFKNKDLLHIVLEKNHLLPSSPNIGDYFSISIAGLLKAFNDRNSNAYNI